MGPERDVIWLPAGRMTAKQIIAWVAKRHQLRVCDLLGTDRHRKIAHARQEAMWEIRKRTKLSLPQIGERLGGRDHSTILHGVRAHERRLAEAQQEAA